MPREEVVARLRRNDGARGRVGGDHRHVVVVQPGNRAGRDAGLVPARRLRNVRSETELPTDVTGANEDDVTGADVDALRAGRAIQLVGSDRKSRFEMFDAEMARDIEEHRPSDDAVARKMVHSQPARASGRGDEPGPVSVVERVFTADMTEAVELRRRLESHDDVVVGHLILASPATASEHSVSGRHAVEMQWLGAVTAGRRRTDGEPE